MNTLKAFIYEVNVDMSDNLFVKNFKEILQEISKSLDDIGGGGNIRILDDSNGKETSIWFDSFDYEKDFSNDNLLKNSICFLLAKDIDFSIMEDKEKEELKSFVMNSKVKPKIPSHCVYLPTKGLLIVENNTKSATIGTIKRGIFKVLPDTKTYLSFAPKLRDDILERLSIFVDKFEKIELIDLNLKKYFQDIKCDDGTLLNLILNPDSKFNMSLEITNDTMKEKIKNIFTYIFNNPLQRELSNIKIKYRNEKNEKDVFELYNNLVTLSIEKEYGHNEISLDADEGTRINYSKIIYRELIKEFYENNII